VELKFKPITIRKIFFSFSNSSIIREKNLINMATRKGRIKRPKGQLVENFGVFIFSRFSKFEHNVKFPFYEQMYQFMLKSTVPCR
jgi:hypothetical protein